MSNKVIKCMCNYCKKELPTQKERIDVYKRLRGKITIYQHYCICCFDTKDSISKLQDAQIKRFWAYLEYMHLTDDFHSFEEYINKGDL